MMGEYWGWHGFGWVFMSLWWILIIVVIVAAVKWLAYGSSGSGRRDKTALDILKERYARGEVNREEFEQKRRDLES